MWKVCVADNDKFLNVEKIFPTQQKDVSTLINVFSKNVAVKKIIIFGSSVTSACNPWSDIDVYVELSEKTFLERPKLGTELDIWTNFDVDDRLLMEIVEKGVVVFER